MRGLYIFMKSAKSLGFCFKQGKEKTKQKDFAMSVAESKRWFAPALLIARAVGRNTEATHW